MTKKRRLAAIMFTDISGFSAMMQEDETRANQILKRHRSILERAHARYQGELLQYFGDGSLSVFDSAVSAVECAVDMQVEFRKEPEIPLRIGIHTGDISYDQNGAFGDGVNIASRVENLCIPGGVYMTAKVYDDIKNHSWLSAINLGAHRLRNITQPITIYAVESKSLAVPEKFHRIIADRDKEEEMPVVRRGVGRKKRTAALLALFFGVFGVHRFYLGQRGKGIAYAVLFVLAIMLAAENELPPAPAFVAIAAMIDAVLLMVMPQIEFDQKYNKGLVQPVLVKREKPLRRPQVRRVSKPKKDPVANLMTKGMRKFEARNFAAAINYFDHILDFEGDHIKAHFYLACCFSATEKKRDAFFHLSQAVKYGLNDRRAIVTEPTLQYLRDQPEYPAFADNNFQMPAALPEPQDDLLASDTFDPLVLDKIEQLGEKLERGDLSRKEFEIQKRKILGGTESDQ